MCDISRWAISMITNFASSNDHKCGAFQPGTYATVADAWRHLDEEYWRIGLTVSLGNGMNVSGEEAKRRLNYIRLRLLRAMFGNSFRRKNAKINFFVFGQGSRLCFNQHYHALMAIEGAHDWSDQQSRQQSSKSSAIDRKDLGKRMCASILIGRKVTGFTATLHVTRRSTRTAFW